MIDVLSTRVVVEDVLRQLKGYVPRGEIVHFQLSYSPEDSVTFDAVQMFGAEDQPQPESEVIEE